MKTRKSEFEQKAIDFIGALQNRNSFDTIKEFYHSDIEHTEYPNTLTKNKTIRNLQELMEASIRGQKVLLKEEYEIINTFAFENTVIVESVFIGTLAIAIGNIEPGGQMKAYFAQFFEFKDGKIFRQRNYDCFEPFT